MNIFLLFQSGILKTLICLRKHMRTWYTLQPQFPKMKMIAQYNKNKVEGRIFGCQNC